MRPEELFLCARRKLEDLSRAKFAVVDQLHDDNAFGSRCITLVHAPERFRLCWDGKEEFLILEWARAEEEANAGVWEDVALWPYPRSAHSDARAREILRELNDEFLVCLTQTVG